MSKKDFRTLTKQERADLAAQVKRVRESLGLTQQELAHEAGVTRQTIGNIEAAHKIPQTKTLWPILQILNLVPEEPQLFTTETERWLAIIGGILDALPEARRGRAAQAAVNAVTQELVAATKDVNVDPVGEHLTAEEAAELLEQNKHALAADSRDGRDDEQIADTHA